MTRIKLHKTYLSIEELMCRWECTMFDMQYITGNSDINVYVRPIALEAALLPLLSCDAVNALKKCPLYPTDIHRAFCTPQTPILVSRFRNAAIFNKELQIIFSDLIILTADVEQYEKDHNDDFILLSPDYREFILHGETLHMGNKQALIIKYLHEKSQSDNPWVHGKELMKIAGSESWKIQNLFGRHKNWRTAIKSDGRGYYRFNNG